MRPEIYEHTDGRLIDVYRTFKHFKGNADDVKLLKEYYNCDVALQKNDIILLGREMTEVEFTEIKITETKNKLKKGKNAKSKSKSKSTTSTKRRLKKHSNGKDT